MAAFLLSHAGLFAWDQKCRQRMVLYPVCMKFKTQRNNHSQMGTLLLWRVQHIWQKKKDLGNMKGSSSSFLFNAGEPGLTNCRCATGQRFNVDRFPLPDNVCSNWLMAAKPLLFEKLALFYSELSIKSIDKIQNDKMNDSACLQESAAVFRLPGLLSLSLAWMGKIRDVFEIRVWIWGDVSL